MRTGSFFFLSFQMPWTRAYDAFQLRRNGCFRTGAKSVYLISQLFFSKTSRRDSFARNSDCCRPHGNFGLCLCFRLIDCDARSVYLSCFLDSKILLGCQAVSQRYSNDRFHKIYRSAGSRAGRTLSLRLVPLFYCGSSCNGIA